MMNHGGRIARLRRTLLFVGSVALCLCLESPVSAQISKAKKTRGSEETPLWVWIVAGGAGLIACAGVVWWVSMLIDCLTNAPSEGNDKVVWVLIIIFLGIFGAVIYAIVQRPKWRK